MLHHDFGWTLSHQQAAALTAFGAEVDQPIRGANHIQVVLDDDQGMACIEQSAQGAHQLGDVVEMQTRGGLIE